MPDTYSLKKILVHITFLFYSNYVLKKKENIRLTVRNSLILYILSVAENDTFFDFESTKFSHPTY
jgi:hypothetical protein